MILDIFLETLSDTWKSIGLALLTMGAAVILFLIIYVYIYVPWFTTIIAP